MVVSRNPFVEPSSNWSFLAQMPFADVRGAILPVLHEFRENTKPAIKWDTVSCASVRVRPGARHERRARGSANRMCDVRPLENHRFRRKLVEIRRMNFYASVTSDSVSSLLVRQKKNQVGLSMCGHIFRSRTKSALMSLCNRQALACRFRRDS